MTRLGSRIRQSGERNFPIVYDTDIQASFIVVADLATRYSKIVLPMRKLGMEVKVLSENKVYELTTLAYGTTSGLDEANWTEKVLSQYVLASSVGQPGGVPPLDNDGVIPPQYLQSIFVNTTYTVADRTARLALPTTTGDFVIQEDDGTTWLKLTIADPSSDSDFAQISAGGSVLSVNGETGIVTIDFQKLYNYGDSADQFNTAISDSPFALSTIQSINYLQDQINDLDFYTRPEVDGFLDLKADKTNVLPLDGGITFIPTTPYQPATKEYVDQALAAAGQGNIMVIGEMYTVDNSAESAQNLSNATWTKIDQWSTKGVEIGTTVSMTTYEIQISRTGYYTISCTASADFTGPNAATGTEYWLRLFKNGSETDIQAFAVKGTNPNEDLSFTATVLGTAGDIFDVRAMVEATSPNNSELKIVSGGFRAKAVIQGLPAGEVNNFSSIAAPTVTNDSSEGYTPGSRWIDLANDISYVCVDNTAGAAVWKITSLSSYIHNNIAVETVWTITHNLNKYPSVTVVDNGNNVVVGDVKYTNLNELTITFTSGFSGKAYLN